MTTEELSSITKRIIDALYNISPKVDAPKSTRIFFEEKRKAAKIISEEEVILGGVQYIGFFDVYKYETETTTENLYRFRILLNKKKEQRLLFTFEAFQFTETGSLFIENLKSYKWRADMDVFKQFVQIAFSKINFVQKINRVTLELNRTRVQALRLTLLENELEELGYSKEKGSVASDRGKVEEGVWAVYVYSKINPSEETEEQESDDDDDDDDN